MPQNENNFLTLLIASEIIITLIAFVGAYFIFKPLFKKGNEDESAVSESEEKTKE